MRAEHGEGIGGGCPRGISGAVMMNTCDDDSCKGMVVE